MKFDNNISAISMCLRGTSSFASGSFKADSHVAGNRIRLWVMTNCVTFIKKNIYCYQFYFGTRTVETMQKDFCSIIFCLLCCMNWWYSWGIIRASLRICTVVKLYDHTLRQRYECIPIRYY